MSGSGVQPYDPAQGVAFKVINVASTTGQDATGKYVPGAEVTYQLKSGLTGTVFLPKDQFNEDAVRAAIQNAAATLYNVSQISQGM